MPTRRFLPLLSVLALTATIVLAPPSAANDGSDRSDNIRLLDREQFPFGSDLAFHDDLVAAGAANWTGGEEGAGDSGVHLYQRDDDGTLDELGFANCSSWHADVDFVPGERHNELYVVQSHDSEGDNLNCQPGEGREGLRVIDVRNPRNPRSVGFAETVHGAHNLTAVGDTGLVYVSSYNLTDPAAPDGISIVDVAANPQDPPVSFLEFPDADASGDYEPMANETNQEPTSIGCHDIGLDLDAELAFCAGISETHIWDISNPQRPVIISIITNPDVSVHHAAQVNEAGDVLLVQDEWAGATGHTTGCVASRQPSGAIWFYDITEPTKPLPQGYWSAPTPDPGEDFCTTHFFGTFTMDDEAGTRDLLVTSYYDHGVRVVDFTNPTLAMEVAFYEPDGATFWAAYPFRGRLYANSFSPATLLGADPENADQGGVFVLALEGYGLDDTDSAQRGHR